MLDGLHEAEDGSRAFVSSGDCRLLITIPIVEVSWGTLAHNSRPIKQNQRLSGHLFCWQFVWFSRLQLPRDIAALPRRACFPVDSIQAKLEHVDGVAEAQERRGLALLCVPHSEHG